MPLNITAVQINPKAISRDPPEILEIRMMAEIRPSQGA